MMISDFMLTNCLEFYQVGQPNFTFSHYTQVELFDYLINKWRNKTLRT